MSLNINVSPGTIFNDNNNAPDTQATLTNAGTVNMGSNDTIATLINSGTINGPGTLTATVYHLNSGSLINGNLGTGSIVSNGTMLLMEQALLPVLRYKRVR